MTTPKTIIADAGALKELLRQTIYASTLTKSSERINRLQLLEQAFTTEQPDKWVPKEEEQCWFIFSDGEIVKIKYSDGKTDEGMLKLGFVHPTKEAAEKHLADYREWLKSRE